MYGVCVFLSPALRRPSSVLELCPQAVSASLPRNPHQVTRPHLTASHGRWGGPAVCSYHRDHSQLPPPHTHHSSRGSLHRLHASLRPRNRRRLAVLPSTHAGISQTDKSVRFTRERRSKHGLRTIPRVCCCSDHLHRRR